MNFIRKMVVFASIFLSLAVNALAQTHWVGSWATSQQLPEPHNALPTEDLRDATLRQIVHLSIGGTELRVHLSNRFGTEPLHFTAVHIARATSPASPKIVEGSDKALTFSGRPDVIVPAGADYVSDAIAYPVAPLSDLAITLYLDQPPASQTGHPGSRTTSYLVHGNQVAAADLPDAKKVEHWYFVSGIDVTAAANSAAIVALGDSITDGHGATTNGNNRWPDLLAKRLQATPAAQALGVLNHGIGGNHLLHDGLGPGALNRFDHDVLAQAGVRYLIVLEGVNDLGNLARTAEVPQAEHDALVERLISAYEQIVTRAHAHGIKVFGATVMPFVGSDYYHPSPTTDADRQKINDWIRTPGHFDAVIDFDKVTRDPDHPDRLLPAFDCGDHLHPSPAGFRAMADAMPVSLFEASPTSGTGAPQIAFTFDDLPAHGPLPVGTTRLEIAQKILAALHDAGVPPTYGFVNGQLLEKQPADSNVLDAWRAAGQPLGNHTWSHPNLNQMAIEAFEADSNLNEPVLSKWMKNKNDDWHWFRYPFLAEGDTPEKRAGIRAFLAGRGYKVAAVTMSFGDWMFSDTYARCAAKGDSKALAALGDTYLSAATESIDYYRDLSHTLYGRDIPYVLLMHIGALDAEMMPRLLKLYQSKGFKFVSLAEAESDEFYGGSTNLGLPPAPDMLEGVMASRGLPLPARTSIAPLLDAMCR